MVSHHIPPQRLIDGKRRLLNEARAGNAESLAKLRKHVEEVTLSHWPNHPKEFDRYFTDEGRQAVLTSDESLYELVEHLICFEVLLAGLSA